MTDEMETGPFCKERYEEFKRKKRNAGFEVTAEDVNGNWREREQSGKEIPSAPP